MYSVHGESHAQTMELRLTEIVSGNGNFFNIVYVVLKF